MKFKKPQYEHYPTKAVEGAMAEKKATKEKAAAEKAETNRILHLYLRATEGEPAKKRLAKLLEKRFSNPKDLEAALEGARKENEIEE